MFEPEYPYWVGSRALKDRETAVRSDPGGLTGSAFSILEHSAGISWLQPEEPVAEAALVSAEAAVVAPDERSGALAAAAGALAEAVAAQALLPAAPDAVAVVVQPGVVAQRAECEAVFEASARPAAWAWEARQRVLVAAVAV
jgi:hypothetical protein